MRKNIRLGFALSVTWAGFDCLFESTSKVDTLSGDSIPSSRHHKGGGVG